MSNWTTTPPKQNGWYWLRAKARDGDATLILQIEDGRVPFWAGNTKVEVSVATIIGEWSKAIKVPK